ncbi:MAG TPA: cobalamin-independent methionine synthase II family protein [Stellaceae bacterium]|nr:cobalamin-independent methionine synthase II family protein [Stellaceae bacterium]
MPTMRSNERILTTHAGSLPRPALIRELLTARKDGKITDLARLNAELPGAVNDVVAKQIEVGLDSVDDGEFGKVNFTTYLMDRVSGLEVRPPDPNSYQYRLNMIARDERKFPEYFKKVYPAPTIAGGLPHCVGPLKYTGHDQVARDIANLKAAAAGKKVAELFVPTNTPGTAEHWMINTYYPSQEALVFAIADCLHEEYKTITDAGLVLHLDDPDLPDGWNIFPDMDRKAYRKYAELRVDALNHALKGIPKELVRLHVCWGSFHGPHHDDIPLDEIIDLIFKVPADSYSIEASNPCHEHEWRVFEKAKLPDGATLVPGVVGHFSDFIEHPDLIADRLVRYAKLVGRENVIAGTDCGIGPRVGHPSIAWAKFQAMAEGARRATKILWGRV